MLFSLLYSRMVLLIVFSRYRVPFGAHGWVFTLINVTFCAKILIERDKSIDECWFIKMNAFSRLWILRLALMIVYFLVVNSRAIKLLKRISHWISLDKTPKPFSPTLLGSSTRLCHRESSNSTPFKTLSRRHSQCKKSVKLFLHLPENPIFFDG